MSPEDFKPHEGEPRRWPTTLVEWALSTLPDHLEGEDRERCDLLRRQWEAARLDRLAGCTPEERVQCLVLLVRTEWHESLADRARELTRGITDRLTPTQLLELGHLSLESGLLRLAEQEDMEPDARVMALLLERRQALDVGDRIRGAASGYGGAQRAEADDLVRKLGRLAKRLHNKADEARSLHRLERIFGRLTWAWFSRFTFACLLLLLVMLVADLGGYIPGAWHATVVWVDTGICAVFLLEFLLQLSCVPRRFNWFRRHFLTDFLPAIPFALIAHMSEGIEVAVKSVRLFRTFRFARYFRTLKPIVGLFRILVFWIRGMDRIVEGMAPLLNRQIVFFEYASEEDVSACATVEGIEEKVTRSFLRLSPRMQDEAAPDLLLRLGEEIRGRLDTPPEDRFGARSLTRPDTLGRTRIIRAEEVTCRLQELTPEEVELRLSPATTRGLARLLALLDIPLVRSLPLIKGMVKVRPGASPAERVAQAGRSLGRMARKFLAGITAWADLSGVITPPQILDRISSAMIRSTQRPAVRLLLFGSLFVVLRLAVELFSDIAWSSTVMGRFLEKFVATPLLVLGGFCLVLLLTARWLKKIAGEASDRLLRSSEARYANLLELLRLRHEAKDRNEIINRITYQGDAAWELESEVAQAMALLRKGDFDEHPNWHLIRARKIALLMLDMQDAGFLHRTDTKGVEQFLSHPDLWNLRHKHLRITPKERRRLRSLDLESGKLFSGPFLWFDLATHATALKVARLCSSYNLHLIRLRDWDRTGAEDRKRHDQLLSGAPGLATEPSRRLPYKSSFFHVLHFMSPDRLWLEEVRREYGEPVVERLLVDRRRLIRELFGTRALNRLPREVRSFNPLLFYQARLSSGRFLLLPLWLLGVIGKLLWMTGRTAARAAREILDPRLQRKDLVDLEAPFTVARRKLRLLKKPLLLEAIAMTARLSPRYLGLDEQGRDLPGRQLWRDDLVQAAPTPQERSRIEDIRQKASGRLLYYKAFVAELPDPPDPGSMREARLVAAFALNEENLAVLAAAPTRVRAWVEAVGAGDQVPTGPVPPPDGRMARTPVSRGLRQVLAAHPELGREGRRRLQASLRSGHGDIRQVCHALGVAGEEGPTAMARRLAAEMMDEAEDFLARREILQVILSLVLQDLNHHEDLVYQLGGYESEAEEEAKAR